MKISIEIIECYDYRIKTKLSCRITAAKDMLDIERKLETQQETQGLWDAFFQDVHDILFPYNVFFFIQPNYFIGAIDVILEIDVEVSKRSDVIYEKELLSEEIAGALYKALFEHFGFTGWYNTPRLTGYRYDVDKFKKLTLFKDIID
jgi:hypothetical protein